MAVYVAEYFHQQEIFSRGTNESMALFFLGISLINFILQAGVFRSQFHLFMGCLSGSFFCREWHFAGTSTGVYVALVLLGIWAFKQRRLFGKFIRKDWFRILLFSTFATYLLSQLIARRVFRHLYLPQEAQLHINLEETVETTAHVMLIIVSFAAWGISITSRQLSEGYDKMVKIDEKQME